MTADRTQHTPSRCRCSEPSVTMEHPQPCRDCGGIVPPTLDELKQLTSRLDRHELDTLEAYHRLLLAERDALAEQVKTLGKLLRRFCALVPDVAELLVLDDESTRHRAACRVNSEALTLLDMEARVALSTTAPKGGQE